MKSVCEPTKEGEVIEAARSLSDRLGTLYSAIESLRDRLSPVLRDHYPTECAECPARQYSAPLSVAIHAEEERIKELTQKVLGVLERLEV